MWPARLHLETKTHLCCNLKPFSCFSDISQSWSPTARTEAVRRTVGSHRRGRPATARAAMRSAQTERRAKVRFHSNWRADGGFFCLHLVPVCDLELYWAQCYLCMSFTWGMRPSVASVSQISMSAVCMGPAASPVPTPMAATPAPVWKDTCLSRTIAPARPRMVHTCNCQQIRARATSAGFVLSLAAA